MVNAPAVAADELTRLLTAEFPQVWTSASGLSIEEVWSGGCRLRQAFREQNLRPGATIEQVRDQLKALDAANFDVVSKYLPAETRAYISVAMVTPGPPALASASQNVVA